MRTQWIVIFWMLATGEHLLAQSQSVLVTHGNDKINLPLPDQSTIGFARNGTIYANKPHGSQSLRMLAVDPSATVGESIAAINQHGIAIQLKDPASVMVTSFDGSATQYEINSVTGVIKRQVTTDNWSLNDNVISLRVADPSAFDSAQIIYGLTASRTALTDLQAQIASSDQSLMLSAQTRQLFNQLTLSLEESLPGDRYAATRQYLSDESDNLRATIASGNVALAASQMRALQLLIDTAPRVVSFDVTSDTPTVHIRLYGLLDTTPRSTEYTNGRILAVSPGKYRLEATKENYADATLPSLDLFRVQPEAITCEMKPKTAPPSICRVKAL